MILADIAPARTAAPPAGPPLIPSRPSAPSAVIDVQPIEREPPVFTVVVFRGQERLLHHA